MRFLIVSTFVFLFSLSNAQQRIKVSYFKNVNLIFQDNIIIGDVSSTDLFVSKYSPNILKVGANKPLKDETSITVLTEGNKFYTFLIVYDENLNATELTYVIPDSIAVLIPSTSGAISSTGWTKTETSKSNRICELVYSEDPFLREIGKTYKKITIEVAGVWINNDILYFKLLLTNDSNINYDISGIHLYVKEKAKLKKASTEPIPIGQLKNTCDNPKTIPAKTSNNIYILAFEKFTISHEKKIVLEVVEKDGGRLIQFDLLKDVIIRAPVIN